MSNITSSKIKETVNTCIKKQVKKAEELGFIDGDFYAYCVDEAFMYGEISKVVEKVKEKVETKTYELDEDDLTDIIYDVIIDDAVYGDPGETFEIFKEHGRANQIPSWYFE